MHAYIVGGWVRDRLLGKNPKDKDWVVIGADEAMMLQQGFKKVGASFPVFLHPLTKEEYALARTEKKSGTGYKGFVVQFSPDVTIEQDLLRRDLTINAIAYDEENDCYFDPFHGREDLHNKVLRPVSAAFKDDPLRLIRLARFAAIFYDFSIDLKATEYVTDIIASKELLSLSLERVIIEIKKAHIVTSHPRVFWRLLYEWGALNQIFGLTDDDYQNFCQKINKNFDYQKDNDVFLIHMAALFHSKPSLMSNKKSCLPITKADDLKIKVMILAWRLYNKTPEWTAQNFLAICHASKALHDHHSLLELAHLIEGFPKGAKLVSMLHGLTSLDKSWLSTVYPESERTQKLNDFFIDYINQWNHEDGNTQHNS